MKTEGPELYEAKRMDYYWRAACLFSRTVTFDYWLLQVPKEIFCTSDVNFCTYCNY